MISGSHIDRLLKIMQRLRDPEKGCAWDLKQNFDSIAPYTIEEAYEVAEAIREKDDHALADELGDLLLQVVFLSQIASEKNAFTFADVVDRICDKMIRRHPHIFKGETPVGWEDLKAAERRDKAQNGALEGVAQALPALKRAAKLCQRAARTGFDWEDAADVLEKVDEEVAEVRAEMATRDRDRLEDEIGDVLFTTASLARKLELDPEACLERSNRKFISRFEAMEKKLAAEGSHLEEKSLAELEALWQSVKRDLAQSAS
ncbi:Nucleoside triphosphate pyrophosphohydrolase [Acetobacteraceae bacterium EV16G]|uniref:Nucleoside triphosphate pyrophosphohydrolase n=1 Tax=Sorlinia euscelidii TaxID=3081148 RepID=A0ABU7TZJ1_9PROT